MISKVNPDPAYRTTLAKLLAMIQLTLKGTPFVFQGQEIGSINQEFQTIEDLRDVESINLYQELVPKIGADRAFKKVMCGSRDHARTPMQWSGEENNGFSEGTPWIVAHGENSNWNVENQLKAEDSVFNFYKMLIDIRKSHQSLIYGEFKPVDLKRKNIFTYYRILAGESFYVECNLTNRPVQRKRFMKGNQPLLSNYSGLTKKLRPYEANLYLL
jgi:oligo-1,6-glucosidase